MIETNTGAPQANTDTAKWKAFSGKRVIIHAQEGTPAAARAPVELHEADRTVEALEKLLEPPERGHAPVQIFLVDAISAHQNGAENPVKEADRADSFVRVVRQEGDIQPLALPLTRLLLTRWYGPNAASATLFIHGIAGYVTARLGKTPTLKDADASVQSALAEGRPILGAGARRPGPPPGMRPPGASGPPPGMRPPGAGGPHGPDPAQGEGNDLAATAFIAYLLRASGPAALRKYLSAYDPARSDQAAMTAYQQPLATLQETWLGGMRGRISGGAAMRAFLKQIGGLIRPYRMRRIELLIYILFAAAYSQVFPIASGILIDSLTRGHFNTALLGRFTLALLCLYLLNGAVTMRSAYVTGWINQRVLRGLQETLFTHLQRLSHNYYSRAKVGDIMSRLSSDLQSVQQAMTQVTSTGIVQTLVAVFSALNVLSTTIKAGVWWMGVLIVAVIPLFYLTFSLLRGRFQSASRDQQRSIGEANTNVQENLSAQAVVKAFGMEQRAIDSYHVRLESQSKASLRLVLLGAVSSLSAQMIMALGQIIVLCVGGWVITHHPQAALPTRLPSGAPPPGLTAGTLAKLIQLVPLMLGPITGLSGVAQSVQSATGALDRVMELSDEPIAIQDKPGALALPPLSQEIKLEHINFSYGGARPILRDLSLNIPSGANVAVVGYTGCGKSTLINLLMRFYDPEAGRVLFDSHDLRDVTLDSLRSQIGLVLQDTFIFDTTLRENIAIAKPDATDAEIAEAAHRAQLDSYIRDLPQGFDTRVGERGAAMAGGQKQRVAIARAILRNPRILILDEATSALDEKTQAEIQDALLELAKGRTTISITHRLSWAAKADIIYALDSGRLVEQGSHAELIKAGGLYQELYEESAGLAQGPNLRSIPLFAELDKTSIASLSEKLKSEWYAAGTDVVRQGDPGDTLYIINNGQAEVVVSQGGGEQRVNVLEEGDFFGEMALLTGERRVATVRTTMKTHFLSLTQADFQVLLAQQPALRQSVERTVSERRAALAGVVGTA